jgi:RepB DNA-primase from phage plasmid
MSKHTAADYILDNFEPDDRLAVVLIDRSSGVVTQRIASARQIASPEFQVWLKGENRSARDAFLSMNALHEQARGRTREDVMTIRHLYLDFDQNGTAAVHQLRDREDIPEPNYLVNTSPDHWQVSWKVQGFGKEQAEEMMRGMVREFGADPAATDSARVMRIPGFTNHKRHPGHMVRAEHLSSATYTPDQFPRLEPEDRRSGAPNRDFGSSEMRRLPRGHLSQSERDWAYARRALSRGKSPDSVVSAIARYRQGEKPDVQYYARHTVEKAAASLGPPRETRDDSEPDR